MPDSMQITCLQKTKMWMLVKLSFTETSTGCFNPSVNFDTILISHTHGAIPKPFNVVIVHMVRFNIMYDNP